MNDPPRPHPPSKFRGKRIDFTSSLPPRSLSFEMHPVYSSLDDSTSLQGVRRYRERFLGVRSTTTVTRNQRSVAISFAQTALIASSARIAITSLSTRANQFKSRNNINIKLETICDYVTLSIHL